MNTPTRQKLASELIAAGVCSRKGRRRIYRAIADNKTDAVAEIIAFESKSPARAKARYLNRMHETYPSPYRKGWALRMFKLA